MGRRTFVERTAPPILERAAPQSLCYGLVDYACPDQCGAWLEAGYAAQVRAGAARAFRVTGRRFFHKTEALNVGARAALDAGAQALCFADADTALGPQALDAIAERLRPGRFLIAGSAADGTSVRSLTGLLVVGADDFRRSGGFDESFEDWGSEDIEMRLRLHLRHGLEADPLPARLFTALAHGDWLRSRFHRQRAILASAARNHARLVSLVHAWTGAGLDRLPEPARRLLFAPGGRTSSRS